MPSEFESQTDEALIQMIVHDPSGPDGLSAREVLEYRKFKTTKRHDNWLLILTVVLASSAIAQTVLGILRLFCP